jgi:transglutaminase-like putative cysteine protease
MSVCATGSSRCPSSGEPLVFTLKDTSVVSEISRSVKALEVWLPFAATDQHQQVLSYSYESPFPLELRHEKEHGNAVLYGKLVASAEEPLAESYTIVVHYRILKRAVLLSYDPARAVDESAVSGSHNHTLFKIDMQNERHVRVDDEIREKARAVVGDEKNVLVQTTLLFAEVTKHMIYDAQNQSFKGATDHALVCQRGNCNDIHALYMSYARALDIPTRLVMGFEAVDSDCEICGYHCWAESYVAGLGWVPIDASCATKYRTEGLHGNLEMNHIAWSRGRDILLEPAQRQARIMYFFKLYAEADGQKLNNIHRAIQFSSKPL